MSTQLSLVRAFVFLFASCSLVLAQAPQGNGNKGREYISEQPPVFNSPTGCQGGALGIADGCTACECDDVQSSVNLGSETVLLHSGQEVCTATDLFLKGRDRGVNLRIMRRHTTRVDDSSSLFGPAWSLNYRRTFELSGTSLTFTGFGRIDSFDAVAGKVNQWDGNQGRLDRAVWTQTSVNPNPVVGTMKVRRPHGTTLVFHGEDRGDGVIVGHMTEVVSPNDNKIQVVYEDPVTEPILLDRRILKLVDSYGRDLDFSYYPDDVGTATLDESRLLLSITDTTTPRAVVYVYTADDLTSVVTPGVATTGGLNDFAGKTTNYTYRGLTGTVLEHALTSVTYPNEVAGSGPARLAWTYEEGSGAFFGFVSTHTIGNGTFSYSCTNLTVTPGMVDITTPVIEIDVTDRRGVVTEVTMNYLGQMLTESIQEATSPALRTMAPSGPYTRTFSYTPDGLLLSELKPLGNQVVITYPTAGANRLALSNQMTKTLLPDTRVSDQSSIVYSYGYEPVFNRRFRSTDPRGFVTTQFVDYMEDLSGAVTALAPKLGLTNLELAIELASSGVTAFANGVIAGVGHSDVNGDGLTSQYCGNVIRIDHPQVSLPSQAAGPPFNLAITQNAVETFAFNVFGLRTRHTDAEENVDEWFYFDGVNLTSGSVSQAGGGYIAEYHEDTTSGAGRNTSTNPAPVNRVTKYGYGPVSGFPANARGMPTQITDPRGIETHRLVNERDQVVKEVRAAVVPAGSGLTAFGYEHITLYDANDNVQETRVEDVGNPNGSSLSGFITTRYSYDILDFVTQVVRDSGGLAITTRYEYDASQNRTVEIRGFGTPEVSRTEWTYDERNISFTTTRGAGVIDAVTATKIDANGNVTSMVDAVSQGGVPTAFGSLSGDVTSHLYDGFDRPRQKVDRRGLETTRTYDASGNVINVLQRGACDSLLSPFAITDLAETGFVFDERDRLVRTNRHVFHVAAAAGYSKGAIDPGALDDPTDGVDTVSSVTIYDRANRAIGKLDADADVTKYSFDGVGRALSLLDPVGNLAESAYDNNDNLLSVTETESAANTAVVLNDEVFVTTFEFDALDRRTKIVEPIGVSQITEFGYDSRDNLVMTRDANGNEVQCFHDALDRQVKSRQYLSASGVGATVAVNNGMIEIAQGWDALHRIITRTDDSGNDTAYGWDQLSRRVSITYGDLTTEFWAYNVDDELEEYTNKTGYVFEYANDPEGRQLIEVVKSASKMPGDPGYLSYNNTFGNITSCFFYDDLGRIWTHCAFNGPGTDDDAFVVYFYDSLGRRTYQSRIGVSVGESTHEYQGASRLVSETYPSGRKVDRSYDGLDRLTEVRDAVPAVSVIAQKEYIGRSRLAWMRYGNGATLRKSDPGTQQTMTGAGAGYDANRRYVRHEWKVGGAQVTGYRNTYNLTNRRTSEVREHMGAVGHQDDHVFDAAYRGLGFRRDSTPGMLNGVSSSRTLDGTDKMLTFSDEGVARAPQVDQIPAEAGLNQYSGFNGSARLYNQEGALIDRVGGTGRQTFEYDTFGRITYVYDSLGVPIAQYVYDAENRRVVRVTNIGGVVTGTQYCYDLRWRVMEERAGGGILPAREYVAGSGVDEHLQMRVWTVLQKDDFYYHSNSLGCVGALTDAVGVRVVEYEYSWLGEPRISGVGSGGAAGQNPYMFQGRRYDAEAALYQFRQRYYDPAVGEFWSLDRTGVWRHGQGNGYSSFRGDPTNVIDPLGDFPPLLLILPLLPFLAGCDGGGDPAQANRNNYSHQLTNYSNGVTELSGMGSELKKLCKDCPPPKRADCEKEADAVANDILAEWNGWWGQPRGAAGLPHAPNPKAEHIGGYFCWDWSRIFCNAVGNKRKYFSVVDEGYFYKGRPGRGKRGPVHYFSTISACGGKNSVRVDDGFFADGFVHDGATWPLSHGTGNPADMFTGNNPSTIPVP